MKKALLLLLLGLFNGVFGQDLVLVNSKTTGELTTCLDSVKFDVEIENPSPFF